MRTLRILIVEDNALNLKLAREILRHHGHETLEAGSVGEARTQLEAAIPDVVLLDVEIPGGGGVALLAMMRGDARFAKVPVVAVTANAMAGDRERLLGLGFDGYISKPINTRTFSEEVEAFVAG